MISWCIDGSSKETRSSLPSHVQEKEGPMGRHWSVLVTVMCLLAIVSCAPMR